MKPVATAQHKLHGRELGVYGFDRVGSGILLAWGYIFLTISILFRIKFIDYLLHEIARSWTQTQINCAHAKLCA